MKYVQRIVGVIAAVLCAAGCGGEPGLSGPEDAGEVREDVSVVDRGVPGDDVFSPEDTGSRADTAPVDDGPVVMDGSAASDTGGGPADVPTTIDTSVGVDVSMPRMDVAPAVDVVALDRPEASFVCGSNTACVGHPGGPVCDRTRGQCVACTPGDDVCPRGQYCVPGMFRCAPGCRDDASCRAEQNPSVAVCETNSRQCVQCVRDEHCAAGTLCVGNRCVAGCTTARPCPSGQSCCEGACVDAQTNAAHCGTCGSNCAPARAQGVCAAGRCTVGMCHAGYLNCNNLSSDGCEVDARSNLLHCGACGRSCAGVPQGSARCEAGECRMVCNPGHHACDGQCLSNDDPNSCGSRCTPCPAGPVGSRPVCIAGGCGFACDTGYHRCGAFCSLNTSPNSCGASCTPCPTVANAESTCDGARCGFRCREGHADCDNDPTNGCESDLTSTATCGSCGRRCPSGGNGTYTCVSGACEVRCTGGYGDCDGNVSNGCEAAFVSDPAHCGACGFACPSRRNADTTCTGAMCGFRCHAGFSDCNGQASDGCEFAGACTRTETLFSDGFESGLVNWSPATGWSAVSNRTREYNLLDPHMGTYFLQAFFDSCSTGGATQVDRVFDLRRAVASSVRFYEQVGWWFAGSGSVSFDDFELQVSVDGGSTWSRLASSVFTLGVWRERNVPLTSYLGMADVRLRFRIYNRCGDEGSARWGIDQFSVTATLRNY